MIGKVIEGSYIGLPQNATGFVFSALFFAGNASGFFIRNQPERTVVYIGRHGIQHERGLSHSKQRISLGADLLSETHAGLKNGAGADGSTIKKLPPRFFKKN